MPSRPNQLDYSSSSVSSTNEDDDFLTEAEIAEIERTSRYDPLAQIPDEEIEAIVRAVNDAVDDSERSKKVTALSVPKKVTASSAVEPLPRKVTKAHRRTDARDQQTLKTIQKIGSTKILRGVTPVADAPLTTSTPLPIPQPSNDNTLIAWEDTKDRLKVTMANRVIAGTGYAFTLNLSPSRIQEAHAAKVSFSRYVARCLDRALKRALGHVPHYWFSICVNGGGRLHIHGGVNYSTDQVRDPNVIPVEEVLRAALRDAGGEGWKPTRHGETQEWLIVQPYPDGWVRYSLRNGPKVRRLISGRSVVIAGPLRRLARQHYLTLKNISAPADQRELKPAGPS